MTRLHLTALGIVTAIGHGKRAVADRLFAARTGLVERRDFIPGAAAWVGEVGAALPEVPAGLSRFDCRNNRLAALALTEIAPEIAVAQRRYGAERIAVILGTSTSGIAEGEAALAARLSSGGWPESFRYTQQEPGN